MLNDTHFCLDTTLGTDDNSGLVIFSKEEQHLTRCDLAEGVFRTSSCGQPWSQPLPARLASGTLGARA
jgi:hypothetical protein